MAKGIIEFQDKLAINLGQVAYVGKSTSTGPDSVPEEYKKWLQYTIVFVSGERMSIYEYGAVGQAWMPRADFIQLWMDYIG